MPGTGLLLAPYNDSMHLGQGFNSFLQVPCVNNAVTFASDQSKVVVESAKAGTIDVSQVVSYSSRLVEKISDVVRAMNISAGSSIKCGSLESSGNSLSVDEVKFVSSDLNVLVSVKVINQTIGPVDQAVFNPIEHVQVDNDKFLEVYGDCYISGFIEGGELHGIVSIKVLDASNKEGIERAIKKQMSSMGRAREPTLCEGSCSSPSPILSEAETTISVSWSGGGKIKNASDEWSLDTLFRAAAAFPSKVALSPQRTWAILTKYDNNRDFVQWAGKNKIRIPQYQGIEVYTSHLLDMYMEYKTNIARLQAVLRNPKDYAMSSVPNAIQTTVTALVQERSKMKAQMGLIVEEIDTLCVHPEEIEEVEGKSQIQSPEAWATRLPVPTVTGEGNQGSNAAGAKEGSTLTAEPEAVLGSALERFADYIRKTTIEALAPIYIYPLCTPEVEAMMGPHERRFVTSPENKSRFQSYRFDMPCGSAGGGPFNDVVELQTIMTPSIWPTQIEITFGKIQWGIVVGYEIHYSQLILRRGNHTHKTRVHRLSISLSQGEFITKVKLAAGEDACGVSYVELVTSQGRVWSAGDAHGRCIIEGTPPTGFLGLKGFYGGQGTVVDRMGAIWGQN